MRCPRCESVLQEKEREGVTVDACVACRGIWLDRGELEKLIARSRREMDDELGRASFRTAGDRPPSNEQRHPHHHHRKRGFLESLSDLFD
jgi:Zn-finger nucleic acid-binding protein